MRLSEEILAKINIFQRNEITEHFIYHKLARVSKSPQNREILEQIGDDELKHYQTWRSYSGKDVEPDRLKIWLYFLISRIMGLTFGIKLMERGEEDAQDHYQLLTTSIKEVDQIVQDERAHEEKLISMFDEEMLHYIGSIVLGLNDALVELTGVLAGLTLALQDGALIALTGSITGVAAALSMGASEYLSTKTEKTIKQPLRAAFYTGSTYLFTVLLLIFPYLVLANFYISLALTLVIAVLIIAFFNFYVSVAQDEPFGKRFMEMTAISLGVAGVSFLIGYLVRTALGVDV